jgi:hypothetical protein
MEKKMAQINISFDTVTKELKIEADGKILADPKTISSIRIYPYQEDKGSISIDTYEMLEDEKITKTMTVYADENKTELIPDDNVLTKAMGQLLFKGM